MVEVTCLCCFENLSDLKNIFVCSKKHYFCAPCGKSLLWQCEVCRNLLLRFTAIDNRLHFLRNLQLVLQNVKITMLMLISFATNLIHFIYDWITQNFSFRLVLWIIASADTENCRRKFEQHWVLGQFIEYLAVQVER